MNERIVITVEHDVDFTEEQQKDFNIKVMAYIQFLIDRAHGISEGLAVTEIKFIPIEDTEAE